MNIPKLHNKKEITYRLKAGEHAWKAGYKSKLLKFGNPNGILPTMCHLFSSFILICPDVTKKYSLERRRRSIVTLIIGIFFAIFCYCPTFIYCIICNT